MSAALTAFPVGTPLTLRRTFAATVIEPCARHRGFGKDGGSFVTVRIANPDGTEVVDVVHCTPSHPIVAAVMIKGTDGRYNVRLARREIGFIVLFRGTWRFLNKLGDPRFPLGKADEHASPDDALTYVNRTLAEAAERDAVKAVMGGAQ